MKYLETEKIELKSNLNHTFEKEVVAFLNSHDGVIYVGVENDGSICGVQNLDEAMKKISDIISTSIMPNPQELVKVRAVYVESKFIIEIEVKKGNALYYINKYGRSSKGCYIRVGTSCRSMTEEQIENSFKLSVSRSDILIESVSIYKPITFKQLKIYYESMDLHLNNDNFLSNLNLINKNGEFNKLAELLSDMNHIGFFYARFKGKDKSCYSETIDYGNQCIITTMERIIDRLEAENIGRSDITSAKRIDKRLVDMECLREAVCNAVAHNDWENSRVPIVYRFEDRFEIISYGGLPSGQTKEDFLKGISKPRSESLMRILRDLGYVERTGHGVLSIIDKYGENAFCFGDDYIIVTLPFNKDVINNLDDVLFAQKDELMDKKANKRANKRANKNCVDIIKLIEELENNPTTSVRSLSKIFNVNEKAMRVNIEKLRKNGILTRVGSNKTGKWIVQNKL